MAETLSTSEERNLKQLNCSMQRAGSRLNRLATKGDGNLFEMVTHLDLVTRPNGLDIGGYRRYYTLLA